MSIYYPRTWKCTATLADCTFGKVELLWIIELSFAALGEIIDKIKQTNIKKHLVF